MDIRIPQEQLVHLIQSVGRELAQNRQLASRLRELFPERYQGLLQEYLEYRGAKRERCCLQDPRYLSSIDELVEIRHRVLKMKVEYETHVMLYEARQSLAKASRQQRRPTP